MVVRIFFLPNSQLKFWLRKISLSIVFRGIPRHSEVFRCGLSSLAAAPDSSSHTSSDPDYSTCSHQHVLQAAHYWRRG
jgi:hypothetical protein